MKVGVIGGGSWGTALAGYLAAQKHPVTLWALEEEVVEEINARHTNGTYLPGIELPANLRATGAVGEALAQADVIFSVVPTQFIRSVAKQMKNLIAPGTIIVSASKGIENETLETPTQIYRTVLGAGAVRLAALGGPSFAREVAQRHPTAVVLAGEDQETTHFVQKAFSSDVLRIYSSLDIAGVELCGAVKNVIALASGACSGLGFGDNSRAALITRGIVEIARLVDALGGRRETVSGMAGLGDMVLTCTSSTSRNYTVGFRLGKGEPLEKIVASMKMIAEGVKTTRSVATLAEKLSVDLPISMAMYDILYRDLRPLDAVRKLMTRELKREYETGTEAL
jgi:glycerol-3-phosphate dehydrogenase (NAD(P)+)